MCFKLLCIIDYECATKFACNNVSNSIPMYTFKVKSHCSNAYLIGTVNNTQLSFS